MPTMIQMQGVNTIHQEIEVPLDDGTVGHRHVLVFEDPVSGLCFQTVFSDEEAKIDADGNFVLIKQAPPSDLLVAGADQMPRGPGQPGPSERPPMAGPGRPGR